MRPWCPSANSRVSILSQSGANNKSIDKIFWIEDITFPDIAVFFLKIFIIICVWILRTEYVGEGFFQTGKLSEK